MLTNSVQMLLKDFRQCLHELLECNAFELQLHTDTSGQTDCYIPYMMNDALECYFVLKDCKVMGDCVGGSMPSVELTEDGPVRALVIRQTTGDVSTLWFQDITKELKCYCYHEIGHFWVPGQEQWRQLVYIIGTIYDKFSYMGESLCNEEELALLPLMEFAPFRYWSPIHESLDEHYPDTMDGITCFKELCIEAEDYLLLNMAEQYEKVICSRFWITDFYRKFALPGIVKKLALELSRSGHETLYELIYQKVCSASLSYPARDYGETLNTQIIASRQEVCDSLIDKGFVGKYPRFMKDKTSVLVTEEHPFTLSALEYENYEFRIQFMVSEVVGNADCTTPHLNQGFFEGNGNKGRIAKSLDEL